MIGCAKKNETLSKGELWNEKVVLDSCLFNLYNGYRREILLYSYF